MADGVQKVGLAESRVAIDEERVVCLGRRLGDGDGRGMGETVRLPMTKLSKLYFGLRPRVVIARGSRGLRGSCDGRRLDVAGFRRLAWAGHRLLLDLGIDHDREGVDRERFVERADGVQQGHPARCSIMPRVNSLGTSR